MMAATIVIGAIGLAVAFALVWLVRPDVRAWLEQPKHRFHDDARRYDRAVGTKPWSGR
jgi:hypothetical protein